MEAHEIEPWRIYEATVQIRRGEGWNVRPAAEWIDGQRITVATGWEIGPEDSSIYVGEWAMQILDPVHDQGDETIVWLASGDLVDMKLLKGVTMSQVRAAAAARETA